jgi:ribosomal protein L37E
MEDGPMTAGDKASLTRESGNGERCPNCGRRAVFAGRCSACGFAALLETQTIITTGDLAVAPNMPVSQTRTHLPASSPPASIGLWPLPAVERNHQIEAWRNVRGRVIMVNQGALEPSDSDPWRWLAIPAWGLVLLLAPVVIGIVVWMTMGILAAAGVVFVSVIVLRFIFSDRLFQSWQFVSALRGRYVVEHVPVATIRVRRNDTAEVQLRIKGHVAGGTVVEGDRVSADGRWRNGVLHVRRVYCERTGAAMIPRQPNAFGLAVAGVAILLGSALWLQCIGVPWVLHRAGSFHASPNFHSEGFHR